MHYMLKDYEMPRLTVIDVSTSGGMMQMVDGSGGATGTGGGWTVNPEDAWMYDPEEITYVKR